VHFTEAPSWYFRALDNEVEKFQNYGLMGSSF